MLPAHIETEALMLIAKSQKSFKAKEYQTALEHAQRAFDLNPTWLSASSVMQCMVHLQNPAIQILTFKKRAETTLSRPLVVNQDDPQTQAYLLFYFHTGEALRLHKRYLNATQAYMKVLAENSTDGPALAGLATCYRMRKEYKAAIQYGLKAVKHAPDSLIAHTVLASTFFLLNRHEEALPHWDQAIKLDPLNETIHEGRRACFAALAKSNNPPSEFFEPPITKKKKKPTALETHCHNLTERAIAENAAPLIGRDKELQSAHRALLLKQRKNVLLVGEPGVGKTALVSGLARILRDRIFYEIRSGELLADTKYRGSFEKKLRDVITEAEADPKVILFVDEIHTLLDAGKSDGNDIGAGNILKPPLSAGTISMIGATTNQEFLKYVKPDGAFTRRFTVVFLDEPTPAETMKILQALLPSYLEHHGVTIEEGVLLETISLAEKWLPDQQFPDKAISLLDHTLGHAKLLQSPQASLEHLHQVLAERTALPLETFFNKKEVAIRDQLLDALAVVKGQDSALETLLSNLELAEYGLRNPDRPKGVYLFAGPSGVGKTMVAKLLADTLCVHRQAFIRLNMAEFSGPDTINRIIGAPPGYLGYSPGNNELITKLQRYPACVVLLDEFEKAHHTVQQLFLGAFDDGVISDAAGTTVSTREAYFILTTNAQVRTQPPAGFARAATKPSVPEFSKELVNRLDEVVVFRPLSDQALREIVQSHVQSLINVVRQRGLDLRVSEDAISAIAQESTHGEGARSIARLVRDCLSFRVVSLLAYSQAQAPATMLLHHDGQDFCYSELAWYHEKAFGCP